MAVKPTDAYIRHELTAKQQIVADEVERIIDATLTHQRKSWLPGQEPEPYEIECYLPRELWQEIERRYTEAGWSVEITKTRIKLIPGNGAN